MGFGAQVVIEEGAPALVRRRGGWNLDRAPTAPSPALATPTASRAVAPFPVDDRRPVTIRLRTRAETASTWQEHGLRHSVAGYTIGTSAHA
jgi:hypothetical protein